MMKIITTKKKININKLLPAKQCKEQLITRLQEMFLIKKTFFPECSTDYLFYVDKEVYQKSLFV